MPRETTPQDWEEVTLGPVQLRTPVPLDESGAVGIDTKAATWEGPNLSVTVDEGPLADPLTSYENRPGARVDDETIGGRPARVVSLRLEDGRYLAAAHFPKGPEGGAGELTISVVAGDEVGEEAPLQIVRSVEFV